MSTNPTQHDPRAPRAQSGRWQVSRALDEKVVARALRVNAAERKIIRALAPLSEQGRSDVLAVISGAMATGSFDALGRILRSAVKP